MHQSRNRLRSGLDRLAAVNLVSPLFERASHAAEDSIEDCAGQHGKGAAAEFVVDEKFDLAGRLAPRMECPAVLHAAERAVEVFDANGQILSIQRDAAGEALVDEL